MRFLALSDTHFGFETGKTSEARKFTYEQTFRRTEELIAIAKKEKVDAILHAGDVFNRSKPRKKVVKRAYDLIEEILRNDLGFYVVPGNHERSRLPESLLAFYPNCHFFAKLNAIEFDDTILIGFPYESKDFQLLMNKIQKLSQKFPDKQCVVLCHQLFDGSSFGPHNFVFCKHHGAITQEQIPKEVNLVVCGHIHKAQSLYNGLVVYPGSVERTSFIEIIEPKGYLLIDTKNDGLHVEFKTLKTSEMNVFEAPIISKELDFNDLQEQIEPGLVRTLLRFTGRMLTTSELESLRMIFPYKTYPLLVISPRLPNYQLKPLYNNFSTEFSFE
ncbi:MAG: metallophosphoesterase family protein [Candidatus Heimdallarchaeota archaeon]